MVAQEIFQELVQHKVSLVGMQLKMEKLLVVVEVEQVKQELVHQDHRVQRLSEEEVGQDLLIVFQDQHYLTPVVAEVEPVIMELQDQELLEQHHHVEQVELEVKLIVELVELEPLIEVAAVAVPKVLIIRPIIIVVEQVVQESLF
jgi:hypothetical protein